MDRTDPEDAQVCPANTRRWRGIAVGLGLYVAICILLQAGWLTLWRATLAATAFGLVAALILGVARYRILSVVTVGVIPVALWVAVWGTYSLARDLLGGLVALGISWWATQRLTRWRNTTRAPHDAVGDERPRRRFVRRFVVIGFFMIWIINSSLDVIFESRTEARTNAPLVAARAEDAPYRTARIGIALSGGGYRAALFHAGVLAELDAHRIPVTAISAVSGGSIVGSYYAAGGDPEALRDAIAAGRLNMKRDMANIHNALRLPFPGEVPFLGVSLLPWTRFGRTDVQANLVDRVFLGGVTLRDLASPDHPRLQICASDLRTGAGIGISNDGVVLRPSPRPARTRRDGRLPYEIKSAFHPAIDADTRVASLVAASGAFPGAFDAVDLSLPATGDRSPVTLQLADGGIVDNLGVGLMLERYRAAPPDDPWRVDVLLVSAGGRIFQTGEDVPGPMQVRRAVDIIYETAGWRPLETVDAHDRPPMILLQPADAEPSSPEFRAFAEADTLADSFPQETAEQLFDLGRLQVRAVLAEVDGHLPERQPRGIGGD